MRQFALLLIMIILLTLTASAQDDAVDYEIDDDTVQVIDSETGDVIETITVGAEPVDLVRLPPADRLYVANAGDATVSVIDTTDNTVIATLELSAAPRGLAADMQTSRVYVTLVDGGTAIIEDDALIMPDTTKGGEPVAPAAPQPLLSIITGPATTTMNGALLLPAAPLCLEAGNLFMTNLPPDLIDVQCRLLAAEGEYVQGPAEIGVQSVIDLGVIHAVDIFSPSGVEINNLIVCARGTGNMIFLDADERPRTPRVLLSNDQMGYTCSLLPDLGTLVLVD